MTATQPQLLMLPPELRESIYADLFDHIEISQGSRSQPRSSLRTSAALRATCRELNQEVSNWIFKKSTALYSEASILQNCLLDSRGQLFVRQFTKVRLWFDLAEYAKTLFDDEFTIEYWDNDDPVGEYQDLCVFGQSATCSEFRHFLHVHTLDFILPEDEFYCWLDFDGEMRERVLEHLRSCRHEHWLRRLPSIKSLRIVYAHNPDRPLHEMSVARL